MNKCKMGVANICREGSWVSRREAGKVAKSDVQTPSIWPHLQRGSAMKK